MISDDRKLETEDAVVHDHPSPGYHPLAMDQADDGFDSEQEAAPPVVVAETQHTARSHLGAQASEGDHQQQHRQMAHEELLTMHHHGSSWLNQHDDYYLPELLEYSSPLDDIIGGEEDRRRRAETEFTSVIGSSDDLDGLYWDSGF